MNSPPYKQPKMEPPMVPVPAIEGGSQKKKFSTSESFKDIRYTDHFIDKTLLIKSLFETGDVEEIPMVLITAPRRFGKSVNMSMTHSFLEKQVDELTGLVIPDDHDNSNIKLFEGLKIMEPEYEEFRNQHFGRYAVLKASFLCVEPVSSVRDALDFCKKVIHEAFKKHRYLCSSAQLGDGQKNYCKMMCDDLRYRDLPDDLVARGLKVLTEYLWLHHKGKLKVFVLIDEYDSMYMQAMSSVNDKQALREIILHSISLVANVIRDNKYVTGAFLTGISHVAGLGLSSALGRISSFRFLKIDDQCDNKFIKFYGFTKTEVEYLFDKFSVPDNKRRLAEMKYNGYQSKDEQIFIYNPWSIVRFLKTGVAGNYWVKSGAVESLNFAFKISEIKEELESAFLNSQNESHVRILDNLEEDHFYLLHSMIHEKKGQNVPTPALFFTFLLEQGYLSYSGNNGLVKIPNDEVKQELHVKLAEHIQKLYGIKDTDKAQCRMSFQNVFSSITVPTQELRNLLVDLKEKLEALVLPLMKPNAKVIINHNILHQVLFAPLLETGYDYATEIKTAENKKPDFFMYKDDVGIIIELKYMPDGNQRNSARAALQQILEKKYYSLFSNEEYFVKPATSYILLGLSFNAKLKVSMCSLQSIVAKTFADLCEHGIVLLEEEIEALLGKADVISF